jgi:hypothetical protein
LLEGVCHDKHEYPSQLTIVELEVVGPETDLIKKIVTRAAYKHSNSFYEHSTVSSIVANAVYEYYDKALLANTGIINKSAYYFKVCVRW